METALAEAYSPKEGKPNFVRYADDFVVFHPTEEGIFKAKAVVETWIKDMGLEMKPSKTRITHPTGCATRGQQASGEAEVDLGGEQAILWNSDGWLREWRLHLKARV